MNSEDTISYIAKHRCSVARFGDGEFQIIEHEIRGGEVDTFHVDSFQKFDHELALRLTEVLYTIDKRLLVCIPYPMLDSSVYCKHEKIFFEREWLGRKTILQKALNTNPLLGDSTFTRFFMHRKDITHYPDYICKLKRIWDGESVIFIEGEKSRLGLGNDLFDNTRTIKRIICPATDAFAAYEQILSVVMEFNQKDSLYLLALGHTATVLAYDLMAKGFWAIDIGHVDIEYEWYKMQAKEKCPIPYKYVNEVAEGRDVNPYIEQEYLNQIIAHISTR